MSISDMLVYLA
jgi:hypothetical protein